MRLVDIDLLPKGFVGGGEFLEGIKYVYEMLKNFEPVDAVAVTRCADCQHCALEYTDQGFGYPSRPTRVCIIHDHETKLDDYCSWAKRKDEGE